MRVSSVLLSLWEIQIAEISKWFARPCPQWPWRNVLGHFSCLSFQYSEVFRENC